MVNQLLTRIHRVLYHLFQCGPSKRTRFNLLHVLPVRFNDKRAAGGVVALFTTIGKVALAHIGRVQNTTPGIDWFFVLILVCHVHAHIVLAVDQGVRKCLRRFSLVTVCTKPKAILIPHVEPQDPWAWFNPIRTFWSKAHLQTRRGCRGRHGVRLCTRLNKYVCCN